MSAWSVGRSLAIAPLLLAVAIAACQVRSQPTKSIDQVLAAHSDSLMKLPGGVGTAIGLCEGERCIKVFLSDSSAAGRKSIPERLEGYRVSVEVTGTIRPLK